MSSQPTKHKQRPVRQESAAAGAVVGKRWPRDLGSWDTDVKGMQKGLRGKEGFDTKNKTLKKGTRQLLATEIAAAEI